MNSVAALHKQRHGKIIKLEQVVPHYSASHDKCNDVTNISNTTVVLHKHFVHQNFYHILRFHGYTTS